MEFFHFLGIDVSKDTIDVELRDQQEALVKCQFKNTKKGMKEMGKKMASQTEFDWVKTLVCLEYTGIYVNHLLQYLVDEKACIWIERPLQIKNTLGMVRGKSDKVDAHRIADYAFRYQDQVRLWKPSRPVIAKLKKLTAIRRQLIKTKDQLSKSLKESKSFEIKEIYTLAKDMTKPLIKQVEKKLAEVDNLIATTISEDERLKQLDAKITSVTGIGKVTSAAVIVTTNEFKDIQEPKKYACYSGIVPYPNSSGSSKRGREKVSHLANKKIKTLLHLCAMSAIKSEGELKIYYEKKVAEGKNKMSVINAIRNKLVHRIFAVIREERRYEKNYEFCLVKP